MPTILLSKSDELYLDKCAEEHKFAFGIIIGQWTQPEKFIVVHLAKNNEDADMPDTVPPETVADINMQALATQWAGACKMTPGSFDVLGVFATSTSEEITNEDTFKHAKNLLADIHNMMQNSNTMVPPNRNPNYVFLTYSNSSKSVVCMDYTHGVSGGTFTSMDCKFVEKPFEWQLICSNYELNDILPVTKESGKLNIEEQLQRTIDTLRNNLAISEIFLEQENVDDTLTLEAYMQKKFKNERKKQASNTKQILNASIFLPVKCNISSKQPIKVSQFDGTIRFSGSVSARIWCNGENTIADVKHYIRTDILRSLATRVQIYCDALADPFFTQETLFVCEPPRRIYFNLMADENRSVQFSEYIFRGEAPTVAVAQAKQVLDLDVSLESIQAELESLADESSLELSVSNSTVDSCQNATTELPADSSKNMYYLGIGVALLVLLVSVLMHYLF